ncbi:MAG: glycerol kinase, partial [Alphaproteobacteria bacterium]|nr:glycerol kinase [Alphaproteobacteria bacterium]
GIAALLADIVFYTERYGIKTTEIKVAGGLSKNRALLRAQADILQMRLLPCVEVESTAVGAAMLAGGMCGVDTSQWETMHMLPAVDPELEPEVAEEKYIRWHQFLNWCKTKK